MSTPANPVTAAAVAIIRPKHFLLASGSTGRGEA